MHIRFLNLRVIERYQHHIYKRKWQPPVLYISLFIPTESIKTTLTLRSDVDLVDIFKPW